MNSNNNNNNDEVNSMNLQTKTMIYLSQVYATKARRDARLRTLESAASAGYAFDRLVQYERENFEIINWDIVAAMTVQPDLSYADSDGLRIRDYLAEFDEDHA